MANIRGIEKFSGARARLSSRLHYRPGRRLPPAPRPRAARSGKGCREVAPAAGGRGAA
jgi:hypothetical protein